MERATDILLARFTEIRLSEPIVTAPVNSPSTDSFLNRVAILYSAESATAIVSQLKEIERMLGRKSSDKLSGSIPIDIDLISYDDIVMKPDDMERSYVKSGLASLL